MVKEMSLRALNSSKKSSRRTSLMKYSLRLLSCSLAMLKIMST